MAYPDVMTNKPSCSEGDFVVVLTGAYKGATGEITYIGSNSTVKKDQVRVMFLEPVLVSNQNASWLVDGAWFPLSELKKLPPEEAETLKVLNS
jgi:hypothetical protein